MEAYGSAGSGAVVAPVLAVATVDALADRGCDCAVFVAGGSAFIATYVDLLGVDRASVAVAADVDFRGALMVTVPVLRAGFGLDSGSNECEGADGDGSD